MSIDKYLNIDDPRAPAGGCGGCQECCTTMAVVELGKPRHEPCRHLCASGCGIYPTRPESCAGWECLWRRGILRGGEGYRPDRLGVVFDVAAPHDDGNPFGSACLIAHVPGPEVADSERVLYLFKKLCDTIPIVVRGPRIFRLYGKAPILEAAARRIEARVTSLGHTMKDVEIRRV